MLREQDHAHTTAEEDLRSLLNWADQVQLENVGTQLQLQNMVAGLRTILAKFSAERAKEPELTVITEHELWAAFRAAHLAGETSPELDIIAAALDEVEGKLKAKK